MSKRSNEPFFRRAYGRLVGQLAKRVGTHHLAAIEDAVQISMMRAVERWSRDGEPQNPEAWLYRVAHRELHGSLRRSARRQALLAEHAPPPEPDGGALLPLLSACCAEGQPERTRLVLALKLVCGFDVREIAQRLFMGEGAVRKRLERGRRALRAQGELGSFDAPSIRLMVYAIFAEGHLSHEAAVRAELCDEAIHLARTLVRTDGAPTSEALLALVLLHTARLPARRSETGALVLLEDQDRALYERAKIAEGLEALERSARGNAYTRYHAEAAVAAAHALSPSFEATPWQDVVNAYAHLERVSPSPLHRLNRALALAELEGAEAGLELLRDPPPSWLEGSYLWSLVLADLNRRAGHRQKAAYHRAQAVALAPEGPIRDAVRSRLSAV
ncbi:MAG: sigma-70 family RNA polymerase sigma factor [Myxococcota bacterium]